MGNLTAFLAQNAKQVENVKLVVSLSLIHI